MFWNHCLCITTLLLLYASILLAVCWNGAFSLNLLLLHIGLTKLSVISQHESSWSEAILSSRHFIIIHPLSANKLAAIPANWSAVADELFECVWPYCGVGVERVKLSFGDVLRPNKLFIFVQFSAEP